MATQSAIPPSETLIIPLPSASFRQFTDLDLQLCRQLDWRFLLRNTSLGNIAYFGRPQGSLVNALKRFSDRTVVFSQESIPAVDPNLEGFDGAVLSGPSFTTIERAARLLKPDGWMYLQLGRHPRSKSFRKALRNAGLCDVHSYWHRPSFEACREIVPLDEKAGIDYVLSRPHTDFAGRIKSWTARGALRTGLLASVLPSVSLLAYKY